MCGNIAMLEDLKKGADLVRFEDNFFFVWDGYENVRIYSEGGQLMDGIQVEAKATQETVIAEINNYLAKRKSASRA